MVSGGNRIAGLVAMLIGFVLCSTGFGAIIGIPLMIIGFALFLPELILLILILFFIVFLAFIFM